MVARTPSSPSRMQPIHSTCSKHSVSSQKVLKDLHPPVQSQWGVALKSESTFSKMMKIDSCLIKFWLLHHLWLSNPNLQALGSHPVSSDFVAAEPWQRLLRFERFLTIQTPQKLKRDSLRTSARRAECRAETRTFMTRR